MKLPFLQESKWPISREPETRVANPSHDTQLQDHLVEEVFRAKDPMEFRQSIVALIQSIRNEATSDGM